MLLALLATAAGAQPPGRFLADALGAGEGLSTAMVYAVVVAADSRVYVGTERGVERFDGARFEPVPLADGDAPTECYALAALGDTLYAQCGRGVYRLDGDRMTLLRAMTVPHLRAGFARAPDGRVWLANAAGLWTVDGDTVAPAGPTATWTPRAVHVDADGIWVGAAEGLFRVVDGAVTRVADEPVRAFLADPGGLLVGREDGLHRADGTPVPTAAPCYVTGLARLPDGRPLLACGDGVQIAGADGTWERFGAEQGLPGAVARGVAASEDGTVWVALWKRGVVRLSEPEVRLWSGADLGVEPVTEVAVRGDRLVVGGWDGAWELGPDLVPTALPHPEERDRDFVALERTPDGHLVVATTVGVWEQTAAGWVRRSERWPSWGLVRDGAGRIWGTDHTTAWTMDGDRVVPLPADCGEPDPSVGADGTVLLVGRTQLWALGDAGFTALGAVPAGCEGGDVVDVSGERWLLCDASLQRRAGAGWTAWEGLAPDERLRAGTAFGDELWVSTGSRLLRVRPTPLALDRASGLPNVTFLAGRTLVRFGEWLVASSAEGVLWLRPDALARPRRAPEARILSVASRGALVPALDALGPEDTFLAVRVGTDRVADPARTRYRFRLDDGPWSTPLANDLIQLPGLEAGAHTLDVEASAAGSAFSPTPATMRFAIPPVWWKRDDVRLGALALGAALAWVVWRERHRRVVNALAYARELEQVRQTFGRFVTPEVAEEALAGRLSTRGEAREVTVLFADLRGFTPLTASMEPRALVELLNAWLGAMVEAIEAEGGVVNKFIGDAVVAIFGAPRDQPDHAARAVRAAARMAAATRAVGVRYGRDLSAGIGVNSGMVIAGPVGATSRMEYTVIGEVVNVAARVETLTRALDRDVLVAEDTVARLGEAGRIEAGLVDLGAHALKGVAAPVRVWAPATAPPG